MNNQTGENTLNFHDETKNEEYRMKQPTDQNTVLGRSLLFCGIIPLHSVFKILVNSDKSEHNVASEYMLAWLELRFNSLQKEKIMARCTIIKL